MKVKGDKVVLALGMVPEAGLIDRISEGVPEVYMIGDCVEAGLVGKATRDGYRIGSTI